MDVTFLFRSFCLLVLVINSLISADRWIRQVSPKFVKSGHPVKAESVQIQGLDPQKSTFTLFRPTVTVHPQIYGESPDDVVASLDGSRIFTLSSIAPGDEVISVYDTADLSAKPLKVIPLPGKSHDMHITLDTLYVILSEAGFIFMIDVRSLEPKGILESPYEGGQPTRIDGPLGDGHLYTYWLNGECIRYEGAALKPVFIGPLGRVDVLYPFSKYDAIGCYFRSTWVHVILKDGGKKRSFPPPMEQLHKDAEQFGYKNSGIDFLPFRYSMDGKFLFIQSKQTGMYTYKLTQDFKWAGNTFSGKVVGENLRKRYYYTLSYGISEWPSWYSATESRLEKNIVFRVVDSRSDETKMAVIPKMSTLEIRGSSYPVFLPGRNEVVYTVGGFGSDLSKEERASLRAKKAAYKSKMSAEHVSDWSFMTIPVGNFSGSRW